MIHNRALARLGILSGAAPALALPGPGCLVWMVLGKGAVVPLRGLVGRVAGLASRALAPRPIRGRMDEGALAGARHAPHLPACVLDGPGRGLRTAPGAVGFAHALGVAVRSLDESARSLRVAAGSVVTVRGHVIRVTGPVTVRLHKTGHFSSLTSPGHGERSWRPGRSCRDRVEAHGSS